MFLSIGVCGLLMSESLGSEEANRYAHEIVERGKKDMVITKVLSPEERNNLDSSADQLRIQIEHALVSNDPAQIKTCQIALQNYLDHFMALDAQASSLSLHKSGAPNAIPYK